MAVQRPKKQQSTHHQTNLRLGLLGLLLLWRLIFLFVSVGIDFLDGRIPLRRRSAASPGTLLRRFLLFLGRCGLLGCSFLLGVGLLIGLLITLFLVRLLVSFLSLVGFGLLRACGSLLLLCGIILLLLLFGGSLGIGFVCFLLFRLLFVVRLGLWCALLGLVLAASLVLIATTLLLILLRDFGGLRASILILRS